jgi:hypothetical protein
MASVLFLGAWGVLMGPVQYGEPASPTRLSISPLLTIPPFTSPTPHFWSEASVHSSLLHEYCSDALLLARGKSVVPPACLFSLAGIIRPDPGPLHYPHATLIDSSFH